MKNRDHLIANILYKYVGHNIYTDFTWHKKEYGIEFCVPYFLGMERKDTAMRLYCENEFVDQ